MLASVSISQVSSYAPQHNSAETKPLSSDLENNNKDKVKSEANKLTQKASKEQSVEDQQTIQQLKARDAEVKAHEQAHVSAAGAIAIGGASFTYQTGPDGVRYAVGGEVNIDTSPVNGDPAATLRKADAIRRAALAPANPSSQDQAVAASATSMSGKARVDLVKLTQKENEVEEQKLKEKDEEDNEIGASNDVKTETSTDNPEQKDQAVDLGSLIDLSI